MLKDKGYEKYCTARNKSWETLLKSGIRELPVNLMKISNYYNIKILSYLESSFFIHQQGFEIKNIDGFSICINNQKIVFYNNSINYYRIRFTIAHELGHCLLNHNLLSSSKNTEDIEEEMQANIFAHDILMPAIVLKQINAIEPKDIVRLCNVSYSAASIRSSRLKKLLERNKFNISYLERQVLKQFKDFIRLNKGV